MVYYNTTPPKDNLDFDTITELLFNKSNNRLFLSDWNSNNGIDYLNDIYFKAFEKSISQIDFYFSSENNECQEIICNYINSYYNIDLSKKQIIVGNNATSLICFYIIQLSSLGVKNYLGLTPIYYSFVDAIKTSNSNIVFYQLNPLSKDSIVNDVEKAIKEYNIQAIIITDPIFCFGITIDQTLLDDLIALANRYGCYIIADLTREGLIWSNSEELIINDSITTYCKADKFAAIYSPCKKMFANGVKTAILLVSDENIDRLFSYQDSFIGSISSMQIKFLCLLFSKEYNKYVSSKIVSNKKLIKSNFDKIYAILLGSNLSLIKPDCGNYTVAKFEKKKYTEHEIFDLLYKNLNIVSLPMTLYNYFDDKSYLFRINLSIKSNFLIDAILKLRELDKYF